MKWLGENMNEIYWNNRLSPYNHVPHFPFFVTGCVDTYPVRVLQPQNSFLRRSLYNPKYGATVVKVESVVDFMG